LFFLTNMLNTSENGSGIYGVPDPFDLSWLQLAKHMPTENKSLQLKFLLCDFKRSIVKKGFHHPKW